MFIVDKGNWEGRRGGSFMGGGVLGREGLTFRGGGFS